jgi:hypothetical protein
MQLNFDSLNFVVGNSEIINKMVELKPLQPFSDEIIAFLDALSKKVMETCRGFSDVATFGFWCRKSALMQEKLKYDDISNRLGRGIVFHSTPSNVPVNFAFSFVTGLLAGNANIVRLPAKDFEQVKIICNAINDLLKTSFKNLKPYVCMVKYASDKEISDVFSSICDSRVIWGGDKTIENLRRSPLKPRANELTFADRYSIAVINADEYLKTEDKTKIAQNFYNDTYFSDQNACTSPRIIFWIGKNKEQAKTEFWNNIQDYVQEKYDLKPVQAVSKLHALYKVAGNLDVKQIKTKDNLITRINLDKPDANIMDYKYNSGFFFENDIDNLDEIDIIAKNRCQTMIYYGLTKEEIADFIITTRPEGIDRFVPIGKSMDFNLIWDGYDLIRELSRIMTII